MGAIRLEEARIEGLNKEVDRWHRSQLIRAYVAGPSQSVCVRSVNKLTVYERSGANTAGRRKTEVQNLLKQALLPTQK